ncbi:MAG: nicotinate phosphoribosyltransferase [Oscillospiraceae bacterium]|nr:nicotinate phosphoribosyltransferase [Oscillospiraceae bacterium]
MNVTEFKRMDPLLLTDFYKTIHHLAYTPKLEYLVSYWTPRMSRYEYIDKVVVFGMQAFIKEYLCDLFNKNFFRRDKSEILGEYRRIISNTMSVQAADTTEIEKLYDLGYLPVMIKAVPEGTRVNIKTPVYEISNTVKGFGWLVNYLETFISVNVWYPMNSASVAYAYRQIVNKYYEMTVSDKADKKVVFDENGIEEQSSCDQLLTASRSAACGDFSMRGMTSIEGAEKSSAAHLLSFTSTATIGSIAWLEAYYNCDCEKEVVGRGVPSTEHSVMSSYGRDGEYECYRHLIEDVFKTGLLSIVSDTYDYWNVVTNMIPSLKESIMARDGKIIIRGDSGNPVDIICGTADGPLDPKKEYTPEELGTTECLWRIFGGFINDKGYKVLDSHIGVIYGDAITYERACEIYAKLVKRGFAASNVTLGIGSYTYQYVTRDSLGQALKATNSIVDGQERQIFKDPKTDKVKGANFKKSQKGMCCVYRDGEDILYKDELTIEEAAKMENNLLQPVFRDGMLLVDDSLSDIRRRLHGNAF